MSSSSVTLHPPRRSAAGPGHGPNPLPSLLQTPSGLALLELQGSIHFADASAAAETGGGGGAPLPIGRLAFPDYRPDGPDPDSTRWMKRVYLYVGQHQRLAGEAKKLPRPVAVVRRREGGADAGGSPTTELRGSGDGDGGDEDAPAEELEVVEIVRYKLVFSQRPEPVETNAAA